MTSTPLSEHTPPTILPAIVSGTMSPYLEHQKWHAYLNATLIYVNLNKILSAFSKNI